MSKFRVAFWNVENLFHWQIGHDRGPRTKKEYEAKVDAVSRITRRLFGNRLPDAVGFAEIGSKLVVEDVVHLLGPEFSFIFAEEGDDRRTGLAFVYRTSSLEPLSHSQYPENALLRSAGGRPRFLNVRATLLASGLEMLFSVNHWKSNLGKDQRDNSDDRRDTARVLGDEFLDNPALASLPIVLMGDFNANPYDGIFDEQRLRGRRSFSTIDDWDSDTATFYNPCWRFLPPADKWSVARRPSYHEPRPQRSVSIGDNVYDQILFSKTFLTNDGIWFCDSHVRYYHTSRSRRYTSNGKLSPKRWPEHWIPGAQGVSDHFPVVATFTVL